MKDPSEIMLSEWDNCRIGNWTGSFDGGQTYIVSPTSWGSELQCFTSLIKIIDVQIDGSSICVTYLESDTFCKPYRINLNVYTDSYIGTASGKFISKIVRKDLLASSQPRDSYGYGNEKKVEFNLTYVTDIFYAFAMYVVDPDRGMRVGETVGILDDNGN